MTNLTAYIHEFMVGNEDTLILLSIESHCASTHLKQGDNIEVAKESTSNLLSKIMFGFFITAATKIHPQTKKKFFSFQNHATCMFLQEV